MLIPGLNHQGLGPQVGGSVKPYFTPAEPTKAIGATVAYNQAMGWSS
jgi:hypothetical protein